MCSTPYGINGLDTRCHVRDQARCVLNALRHQWFRHIQISADHCYLQLVCSTPYGINGLDTSQLTPESIDVSVLNALRHQWFRHVIYLASPIAIASVLNALRHQWFRHLSSLIACQI